jgi:hypothetical protein
MTQLEYWLDGEWKTVVRYDHDEKVEDGHDVSEEGLHVDVYRAGRKVEMNSVTGPIQPQKGFNYAEEDLRENAERYIKRFEKWHDIRNGSSL